MPTHTRVLATTISSESSRSSSLALVSARPLEPNTTPDLSYQRWYIWVRKRNAVKISARNFGSFFRRTCSPRR